MSIPGKVLIVLENRPASTDTRIWAITMTLIAQNFEVSVIGPRNTIYDCKTYVYPQGVHLYSYRLPRSSKGYIAYLFEYALSMCQTWWLSLYVLYKHGFDVIHAANPPDTFFFLGWFYHPFGKYFIFDQHDLTPELFQAKFGERARFLLHVLRWLEKCSYYAADLVLTTNESQKEKAIERGCPPEKVHIVRNGPDLKRLYRVPAEPDLKRGYPFLLVYVGGMENQDGIEHALIALHELVFIHERRDIMLALLGTGSYLPVLQKLVQDLSLESFVHFTGWVGDQEIRRYLSTADIGLCPDPRNGLNEFSTTLKSMEYMAMGLPGVAFDLRETHYTMQEAALYAEPNSTQDFARQILRLLDNPALRATRGNEGRARIETCLSWEHVEKDLLRAYATFFPPLITTGLLSLTEQKQENTQLNVVPDYHSLERDEQ